MPLNFLKTISKNMEQNLWKLPKELLVKIILNKDYKEEFKYLTLNELHNIKKMVDDEIKERRLMLVRKVLFEMTNKILGCDKKVPWEFFMDITNLDPKEDDIHFNYNPFIYKNKYKYIYAERYITCGQFIKPSEEGSRYSKNINTEALDEDGWNIEEKDFSNQEKEEIKGKHEIFDLIHENILHSKHHDVLIAMVEFYIEGNNNKYFSLN